MTPIEILEDAIKYQHRDARSYNTEFHNLVEVILDMIDNNETLGSCAIKDISVYNETVYIVAEDRQHNIVDIEIPRSIFVAENYKHEAQKYGCKTRLDTAYASVKVAETKLGRAIARYDVLLKEYKKYDPN